jgi:flagellin-like protein
MQLKQFLGENDAVSPVIGVILMVAITVILAAVIGTFVLGIGQDQQTTPQASFDFEYDAAAGDVTVTHAGGNNFDKSNSAEVVIQHDGGGPTDWMTTGTTLSAGDTETVSASAGSTVRVIWTSKGGGESQEVAKFEVPE